MTARISKHDAAYLRLLRKGAVWDQTMTSEFYAAASRLADAGLVVFVPRKNGNGHAVLALRSRS